MSVEDNHACSSNLDNRVNRPCSPQRSDANAEDLSESPLPPPDLTEGDDDDDDDDDFPSVMTASYSEICFDQDEDDADLLPGEIADLAEVQDATMGLTELVEQLNRDEGLEDPKRPHSLPLIADNGKGVSKSHRAQQTSCSQATSPGSSLISSEDILEGQELQKRRGSGLSDLQGTLTFDGDLVNFVAEDLHEKIKLSSPVARKSDAGSFPGSRSSTPSLYRQALQPPSVGLVDPAVLADLESEARAVAASVDTLLENLGSSLHRISSLTVDCVKLYENSMCKTCDSVDANIKTMYQLMVKYEELSKSMRPLYSIASEVLLSSKNIKRLLDHFENIVEGKT